MSAAPDWSKLNPPLEARAMGFCEKCGTEMVSGGDVRHHRKLRSQGGRHTLDNLVLICQACHTWIHANPGDAYALGWLVNSWNEPHEIPIIHSTHGKITLCPWGGVHKFMELEDD